MRDEAAFDGFYRATAPRVLLYMDAVCGDRAEAQDLTQEAYARAWQRWSRLDGYDDPEAWVRTVAWRLAANHFRSGRRRLAAIDRGDHEWSVAGSGFAGDESLLLRLRGNDDGYFVTPGQCCDDFYVAVVRAGEVLVVVSSLGWEGGGGDPQFAKQTAATALTHARALS